MHCGLVSGKTCGWVLERPDSWTLHLTGVGKRQLQVHVFSLHCEESLVTQLGREPAFTSLLGTQGEAGMKIGNNGSRWVGVALAIGFALGTSCLAQEKPVSRDEGGPAKTQAEMAEPETHQAEHQAEMTQPADGSRRNGLPPEAYAVTPGTRLLVRLEDDLGTGDTKEGRRFSVRTLEPMLAGSGIYLPSGAEIRGHVSRVQPAAVVGRAKIWLVFDEIRTKFGTLPIVADVVGVPGDHSVRTGGPEKEGLIEGKTSTQQAAGQAAAEGAGMGALHGIKDKNAKEAAEGAAEAALAAYLMEVGRGHELELAKGSKLELELGRALFLLKD